MVARAVGVDGAEAEPAEPLPAVRRVAERVVGAWAARVVARPAAALVVATAAAARHDVAAVGFAQGQAAPFARASLNLDGAREQRRLVTPVHAKRQRRVVGVARLPGVPLGAPVPHARPASAADAREEVGAAVLRALHNLPAAAAVVAAEVEVRHGPQRQVQSDLVQAADGA